MRPRRRLRLVAALAAAAWRALGAPHDRGKASALTALLLEDVLRRPILYEDGRGLSYLLYPGENAIVYLEHDGNYEVAESAFCERNVRAGATVFDVGANIGLYALLLSKLVGAGGVVHAFEPEPVNYRRLVAHLALNDASNVRASRAAVFREDGTVTLNVFGERLNAWHSVGRPKLPDPYRPGELAVPVGTVAVEAVSLDRYCERNRVAAIDLLKLDVEGAELEVLEGARRLLENGRVAAILFEVSLPQIESLDHTPDEIFSFLDRLGYQAFALGADGTLGERRAAAGAHYGNYVATRDANTLAR